MTAAHLKAGFVAVVSYPILFIACFYGTGLLIAKAGDMLQWHPNLPRVMGPIWGFSAIGFAAWLSWRIYKRVLIYFKDKPSLFSEH